MPTERPSPRSVRRAAGPPPKIPTGFKLGPIAPYVIAAASLAGLVYLVRQPRTATIAALLLGLVVTGLMAYVALATRHSLPPDDGLRRAMPVLALLAVVVTAVPFAYTLYPPPPQGEVALASAGDARAVSIRGVASNVRVAVRGGIVPTATGVTGYTVEVSREGAAPERIDGAFHPHEGGPLPDTHVLAAHGPGAYTVRLLSADPAVALPLRVSFTAKPFGTLVLALLYGALAAGLIAVDVMLRNRGLESSFAPALLVPLVAVLYFQHRFVGDSVPSEIMAAGLVGALAGGIGAEIVARVLASVVGK